MNAMYMLTGWRHDDFPVEIELTGSALTEAVRLVGPILSSAPISYAPISAENAVRLAKMMETTVVPGTPFYEDGVFKLPGKVRSWEIVVQRLYKFAAAS